MCGIAGILLTDNRVLDVRPRLAAMTESMLHRGPNDGGQAVLMHGRVGLSNRRLAIRDLSSAGHMPMSDESKNIWITYNGEIYNQRTLGAELAELGHQFHSRTDTELILRGYQQWGDEVASRLRGMFAFGIADLRGEGRVLLARDRIGVKPLYYARTVDGFAFASEIRALELAGLRTHPVTPAGAAGFLLWGSVPSTGIRDGIAELEPATTLSIGLETPELSFNRRVYWQPPKGAASPVGREEASLAIRDAVIDAVASRMVSDVPIGAFLSGGLDSTVVASVMQSVSSVPIRTCSIAFPGEGLDEGGHASAAARYIGSDHYERVVTATQFLAQIDDILDAQDSPSIDGVNTYFVSETAKEAGLTVSLSGVGGDELFGGYKQTFGRVPSVLSLIRWADKVPGGRSVLPRAMQSVSKPGIARLTGVLGEGGRLDAAYYACRGLFSLQETQRLLTPDVWEAAMAHPLAPLMRPATKISPTQSIAEWISTAEISTYAHNQLLRDTDAMSMAHSLEVRVPLFDHRLIEVVASVPPAIRFSGARKSLFAEAMMEYLPEAVVNRRKQGFAFPFDRWFRQEAKSAVQERVLSVPSGAPIRSTGAARVWEDFIAGRLHWSRPWAIAVINHFSSR